MEVALRIIFIITAIIIISPIPDIIAVNYIMKKREKEGKSKWK
jgi:uncharacterized SAM-binding protein YcdF (DUF218 family)